MQFIEQRKTSSSRPALQNKENFPSNTTIEMETTLKPPFKNIPVMTAFKSRSLLQQMREYSHL